MQRKESEDRPVEGGGGLRIATIGRTVGVSVAIGSVIVFGWFALDESRTSRLQAQVFSELAGQAAVHMKPGPSDALLPPPVGPYDHRMGYASLPEFLKRLEGAGFEVIEQARASMQLVRLTQWGLFAPYREKGQAGLALFDRNGQPMHDTRYPQRVWSKFDALPPSLVQSLVWIENRELLEDGQPTRNPAVEWDRLGRAVQGQLLSAVGAGSDNAGGGSTLATQLEKYRHSPEGRTLSVRDKLQQMASASVRAYLEGENTTGARQRIVLDYINTVPLSARPGFGEVNGIGDGMWAWYGRDFDDVRRLLAADSQAPLAERALAFKQALSLLVAERRPSYYLGRDARALATLTDRHLHMLADAGLIDMQLRDAALAQTLTPGAAPVIEAPSFIENKAANLMRTGLSQLLGVPRLYDLDRLDLTATSTLDGRLQQDVTTVLRSLGDPNATRQGGPLAGALIGRGNPADITWSFTLVEAADGANRVRIQADNMDQPIDMNQGSRLDLGSTAKLRTLVTYLEVVAELHAQHVNDDAAALAALGGPSADPITRWAAEWLAKNKDRDLTAMLQAALLRNYSASPGESFFTGGGLHTFGNFNKDHNGRVMNLHEAFRHSVNLPFVRLMRDIARYEIRLLSGSDSTLLRDESDARRAAYLTRFADREGSVFVARYFERYRGRTPDQIKMRLVEGMRPTPSRLAAAFATLEPQADESALAAFIARHLPDSKLDAKDIARLHDTHSAAKMSLADRGYVARVHPLELVVARLLRQQPGATLSQVIAGSAEERQASYAWLLKTSRKGAQDVRIRTLIEEDAFASIHRRWQRLGFPFGSLVPSYATSLGASADRPAALAELMGTLINDGRRLPTIKTESLHFAKDTPWETRMERSLGEGEQVLPVEVARVARSILSEVVEFGTARRLHGAVRDGEGKPVLIGGKTGTGDHRHDTYGAGGALVSSRVVSRSATFVFFLGERHFGTISAHVRGPAAAQHEFTSGLAIQAMQTLAPVLTRAIEPAPPVAPTIPAVHAGAPSALIPVAGASQPQ